MSRRLVDILIAVFICALRAASVQAHVGTGIDVDREGRVYFTDTIHNRIWRLDPDGKLMPLAHDMHLDFLIVADDGNVYLIDDRAWRLTPQGELTELLRSTEIPKTIAWAFAFDERGNVIGPQPRFGKVNAAAIGPDGSIYALDQEQHIQKVGPDGAVSALPHSEEACYAEGGEEKRQRIMGLAVDSESNVYVANYWKRSVFKLTPQGTITAVLISRWPWVPVGVAATSTDVYVIERMSNPYGPSGLLQVLTLEDRLGSPKIRKISRDGAILTVAVVPAERSLAAIVVPFAVLIVLFVLWRIRRKQLKRTASS